MGIFLTEILKQIEMIAFIGNENIQIREIVALDGGHIESDSLLWCSVAYQEKLVSLSKGTVIIDPETCQWLKDKNALNKNVNWIVAQKPRSVFSHVLKSFFAPKKSFGTIAKSAIIHASVELNVSTVEIGEHVVIEEGVTIGNNVSIGHNTVILKGCVIGDNVLIGHNTTLGGVGFGYEIDENGNYEAIPHIGNVVLRDGVEIGNSVTIDRAVLGATLLNENVKVDNLVHIAHGVVIGKNSLVIANSMIAGSVVIGENVWVSPSVSVIQKISIGDNALVGMGSVVIKNVDASTIVAGVPAKKIKDK